MVWRLVQAIYTFLCVCYRGELRVLTVKRAYDINKAEGSCQTNDDAGDQDYRVKIEPQS